MNCLFFIFLYFANDLLNHELKKLSVFILI